ncbi:MAG: preprotein translocase subunit YajC [Thermodesulfobacteriota bacterium]
MFFSSYALAQDGAVGGGASGIISLFPLILIFAIFYFLLIRPQQKKAKEQNEMRANLKKGDQVVTTGGIHGKITAVSDDTITLEIANQVRIKVTKGYISSKK